MATASMDGTYQTPLRIQQSSPPPPRPLLFFRPAPPAPSWGCPVRPAERSGIPVAATKPVYVQTLDGVVYLTAQVATDLQRDRAEAVAREASGVSRVMNTIALTYAGR